MMSARSGRWGKRRAAPQAHPGGHGPSASALLSGYSVAARLDGLAARPVSPSQGRRPSQGRGRRDRHHREDLHAVVAER